ncbi:MAG: IS66 family transposase [Nitrosomonadales bacterium]
MLKTHEKSSVLPPDYRSRSNLPEFVLPDVLPTDPTALTALLIACVNAKIASDEHITHAEKYIAYAEAAYETRLRELYEQIILMRRRMFGASSESAGQLHLFNEAEVLAATSTEAQDIAPLPAQVKAQKAARGKRSPLPPELKRVEIIHDVPESERTCDCGIPMVVINRVISEQLDIVPMQVRVLQHIRLVYGCRASEHAPVTAMLPPQPLPKSNASPSLLAMLLTTKYVDGLPLARFEKVLARHDVTVPRQTLARWVIGASAALQPLHNLMRDVLFDAPFIHMDETVVQVLKEKNKNPASNSYMWVQTGGPPGQPVVIYDYDPSRSGEVPARLLLGYQGYLMTDGYEGYNKLVKTTGIEHLVCWAHVRRKFVEAVKVQPKGTHGHADQAVAMIGKLYAVEREYKDSPIEVRYAARQEKSNSVLNELHEWLETMLPKVPPKSALGGALSYMRNYWSKLTRYTERGDLPIDNNRCENTIRPFVVGRKAWLFSDTPAGANASAIIYSLVETAKANGVEPYTWLRHVLEHLPAAQTADEIDKLLPWNFHAATLADITPR